jgi:hypothetical protein
MSVLYYLDLEIGRKHNSRFLCGPSELIGKTRASGSQYTLHVKRLCRSPVEVGDGAHDRSKVSDARTNL